MKDYQVVEAGDVLSLAIQVNALLERGWVAQGGVASYAMERGDHSGATWTESWFIQALVIL